MCVCVYTVDAELAGLLRDLKVLEKITVETQALQDHTGSCLLPQLSLSHTHTHTHTHTMLTTGEWDYQ